MRRVDYTGQRFGRLTVVGFSHVEKGRTWWECKCDCGKSIITNANQLQTGLTASCGCLRRETTGKLKYSHGQRQTRLYNIWCGMKQRCLNPNDKSYVAYGGRGIAICVQWMEFAPFYNWAIANGYREDLTIDRIDNNGNYEPSNCRWSTLREQESNRRDNVFVQIAGEIKTLSEWSRRFGISRDAIKRRFPKHIIQPALKE